MRNFNFKTIFVTAIICLLSIASQAQKKFTSKRFFEDTNLIKATLVTDLSNLTSGRIGTDKQSGVLTLHINDTTTIKANITMNTRGHMRKETCYMPPLKVQLNADSTSPLAGLKSLKLVVPCEFVSSFEQLLIKEYLIYKMYNLLSDYSFRVRLIALDIEDSKGKKKGFNSYAFFLEDFNQVAKRNNCTALENIKVQTESTNRLLITQVSIFEYMIGNTDWSVPNNHNIKVMKPKDSAVVNLPYPVPYDFDYSGLVNAPYAVPDPDLPIEFVTQRLYRGFGRNMGELTPIVQKFLDNKTKIYDVINNCAQLSASSRKQVAKYLDDFFDTISKPSDVKIEFIDKAREVGGL